MMGVIAMQASFSLMYPTSDILAYRIKPRPGQIRFAGVGGESTEPPDEAMVCPDKSPDKGNACADKSQTAVCKIIEDAVTGRLCKRVDLNDLNTTNPRGEKGIRSSKGMVPLRELLTPMKMAGSSDERTHLMPLSPHQRAELALVLTCTILQLCSGAWGLDALKAGNEGAWLHRDWTQEGICFLPGGENKPDITRPYLPIIIDNPCKEAPFDYYASSIVALAITLIQLQADEVIKKVDSILEELIQDGGMTPSTNYCAVLDLFETDTFKSNVHDLCQSAIRACVKGDFANSIGIEDEAVVQKHFLSLVLAPLKEYHDFTGRLVTETDPPQVSRNATLQNRRSQGQSYYDIGKDTETETTELGERPAGDADRITTDDGIRAQGAAFQTGQLIHTVWLQELKDLSDSINKDIPSGIEVEPIRVAILDTGVNMERRFFKSAGRQARIKGQADFVPGSESFKTANDTFGHGSMMAQLLMEAAPLVDVYIARVAEDTKSLAKSTQGIVAVSRPLPFGLALPCTAQVFASLTQELTPGNRLGKRAKGRYHLHVFRLSGPGRWYR
jgi:hypothetical protein